MIKVLAVKCLIMLNSLDGSRLPQFVEGKPIDTTDYKWTIDFEEGLGKIYSKDVLNKNSPYVRLINSSNCLITEWRKNDDKSN